ncbi:MAG TPA: hypothetical protein DCZ88_02265, partial [Pseudanabaena sp.]|nr:hypothetical protein [Pseudanabaena sp.]
MTAANMQKLMNSKTGQKRSLDKSLGRPLILVAALLAFLIIANIAIAVMQPKEKVNGELWLINRVVSGQTVEASILSNP